jgi:hypothetical protein
MTKVIIPAGDSGKEARPLVRWRLPLLLAVLVISLGSNVFAQPASTGATNSLQPFFAPVPPEGFDPVAASDADLRTYGFPPRPTLPSTGYPSWVNMVRAAKNRIANPSIEMTNIVHRPPQKSGPVASVDYGNWSGIYVTGPPNYFMANGSYVVGVFSVPTINTSVENCYYGPYITSMWVGFDGAVGTAGAGDVLQAGIDANACPVNGFPATPYKVWYAWPSTGCDPNVPGCSEAAINGFTVHPGDTMAVTVTYYTTNPNGNAFIVDYSTGQYVSVGFNRSFGVSGFQGSSAEWIVERPGLVSNPSLDYDLADYVSFHMDGSYNGWLPGSGPASAPTFVNMVCLPDQPWNPSSACLSGTTLSYVSYYDPGSGQIYFTPAGPTVTYNY